jgi:hypothetical protein
MTFALPSTPLRRAPGRFDSRGRLVLLWLHPEKPEHDLAFKNRKLV